MKFPFSNKKVSSPPAPSPTSSSPRGTIDVNKCTHGKEIGEMIYQRANYLMNRVREKFGEDFHIGRISLWMLWSKETFMIGIEIPKEEREEYPNRFMEFKWDISDTEYDKEVKKVLVEIAARKF